MSEEDISYEELKEYCQIQNTYIERFRGIFKEALDKYHGLAKAQVHTFEGIEDELTYLEKNIKPAIAMMSKMMGNRRLQRRR